MSYGVVILTRHFSRSSGEQIQTSLSPPHDPFNWRLKNIAPILMMNMAIDKTKSVIKNVFMSVKITPLSVFNKMNIYEYK